MANVLTPAQGRLMRVLRQQRAHLIRLGVTGWRFSSQAAETAWGKPLREDTVMGLAKAGLLMSKPVGRGRVEFHLVAAPPQPSPRGGSAPEVGQQEGHGEALVA